jgi:TrbL/VirB6 plasmid conjugal transfer protein
MTIQLFVADGPWNIAQVVSATRAGSNVVYEALIPWVFLAGFGMLVYEAFKVYQGSTASITGALLRIGVAVGLLTNFHTWTGEIGSAINGMVQEIGGGNGQDQLMADYAAVLQNPGKNDQSSTTPWWNFIAQAGASVGDQMMRVMLWLLGAIAYALYWLMQLLQQFLLLMTIAAAPVFIGLWMLTGTRSIGMRYFLTLMSLELWPLGWALGNIVTKQMLSAVSSMGGAWLMIESTVFVVVGLWIVINAVFWPLVISKALIGGGSHALSWMSQSISPVMTAGQQTTSIATTVASGGSAASVQAGSRGLASRPSGSPKP